MIWVRAVSALVVNLWRVGIRSGSTKAQRRKTNHLIAQYMYTASQMPATIRDSW